MAKRLDFQFYAAQSHAQPPFTTENSQGVWAARAARRSLGTARETGVLDRLYRETAEGCPSYPSTSEQADALIALFTMEKALYELRYELDNRPDWIDIPLRGLLKLVPGGQLTSPRLVVAYRSALYRPYPARSVANVAPR